MIEVAMAAFYIAMGERTCEYYNSQAEEKNEEKAEEKAEEKTEPAAEALTEA